MKKPDELKRFGPGDEEEETKTSHETAEVATNQEAAGDAASE